ncbi:serine protease inhibitor family protein [Tanacetum coccineum]
MTSKKKQFVREYDGFKVLRLPYLQGEDEHRFTMYFFLPNEKDGLPQLIQKIGSESDFMDRHMPHRKKEVGQFLIPKFKISFGFEASDMVKELGLVFPFTDKEVNEEGTKAVAVTGAVCMAMSLSRPDIKVDFVADHSFLIVIKEDISVVVLFWGQVFEP